MGDEKKVFPEFVKSGEMAVSGGGMTLRQYYAGQAMNAILSNPDQTEIIRKDTQKTQLQFSQAVAWRAVSMADDLIEQLEKPMRTYQTGG